MRSGGDWKGEIQGTDQTEHAITVMKRSRKHNPGAYQCCKGARECVDDQYNTLPVRDWRRSCASAEDVMRAGSTQKSPCALQGGRNDWHKVLCQARRECRGPDRDGGSHYKRGTNHGLAFTLPAHRGPGNEERYHHPDCCEVSEHCGDKHQSTNN